VSQDDFYLLDLIGGQRNVVLHSGKPVVAYSTGCTVVVHNLFSDDKI